jgi:hypothetical protein
MNCILKSNNLFLKYNSHKKEIDYLSIEEYFDSITSSIKYEIRKHVVKFCSEILVNKLSEVTENNKSEWKQETRLVISQIREKYESLN